MGFRNIYRAPNNPLAISPGELRQLVQLAHASSTADNFGQQLTSWPVYLSVHAKIENLSGQELFQGNEFSSADQVRITIRWPGLEYVVRTGDRVFFGSHIYVVQVIDNVLLRNRVLKLNCLEIDGSS
jgi:SPP1 family predicted phage head-tail adaptor